MAQLPTGTVTFLFTDIEGSTKLLQRLGPDYALALGQHQVLLRDAFAAHGGVEVDTQGDAFFAAFPTAPEAVAAAAEATSALAHHAWPEDSTLRVRIGLHTGTPQLVGDHYVGLDVHRAARIAAAGHGGQVLLSQATRELVATRCPLVSPCVTSVHIASKTSRSLSCSTSSCFFSTLACPLISRHSRLSIPTSTTCHFSPRHCWDARSRWPRCAPCCGVRTCDSSR